MGQMGLERVSFGRYSGLSRKKDAKACPGTTNRQVLRQTQTQLLLLFSPRRSLEERLEVGPQNQQRRSLDRARQTPFPRCLTSRRLFKCQQPGLKNQWRSRRTQGSQGQ